MHSAPRILIMGAGAIGCTLAWHLAGTQAAVTLLARGARADALAQRGITLRQHGQAVGTRPVRTVDALPEGETWDAVFVCVKQYDLAAALHRLQPLIAQGATVIPVINGVPWWLLQTHALLHSVPAKDWGAAYADYPHIDPARLLGGVIHVPAEMLDDCTVEQGGRNALLLGEIDGTMSPRLLELTACINQSALQCEASSHIQNDLWTKLLGNVVFNPVSALANATMHEILNDAELRALCVRMMTEAKAVGNALGLAHDVSVAQRIQQGASAGHARTSMLQDALAGKRIEGDTLVGSVTQIARHTGIATPALDGVWALLRSRFLRTP
ncbi:2-dehydropantoate 2-reductase [Diaphorobacter sp.]|uniref:ketopantoate reductase family protein n=1 Tax=Diaphorobacter sp. TaxID=1934310 RepID=UPI0028AFF968|nr:2-dehydropantoate 2-reductase [Diaphorobacter sp.]